MPSPTQRTLDRLRDEGWLPAVVEKRIPYCNITKDLYGCIDILAIKPGEPMLGIQATSRSNMSARYHKSIAVPDLKVWLEVGGKFQIWAWGLVGPRGKPKIWTPAIRDVTLEDIKNPKD